MKVNFFLQNPTKELTSVDAVIRYKGKRYKIAVGASVKATYWDNAAKRAKEKKEYPDAEAINIQLSRFDRKVSELFEEYTFNKIIPTLDELKEKLKNSGSENKETSTVNQSTPPLFVPYFREYVEKAEYKIQTTKNYKSALRWLEKFEKKYRKKLVFEDIDLNFYDHFRKFVLSQSRVIKDDNLQRKYSINYFGSLIKCIKHVMNVAGPTGRLKLHDNTDYKNADFKVHSETADTIYLSVDELKKIHDWQPTVYNISDAIKTSNVELRMRAVKAMVIAKNKFLIGAFTALRVSDFNRLSEVNIQEKFIRIKPKKGTRKNEDVVIPIHPIVNEILSSGFEITTPISDQKLNKQIKQVCRCIGFCDLVSVSRTEGNELIERTLLKWELISSHTARRSGATNMYLAGIPSISIMKITGHKTEKSFLKYIKISQEENARLLANHNFFK